MDEGLRRIGSGAAPDGSHDGGSSWRWMAAFFGDVPAKLPTPSRECLGLREVVDSRWQLWLRTKSLQCLSWHFWQLKPRALLYAQPQLGPRLPIRPLLRQADAAIIAGEGASISSPEKRLRSSNSLGLIGGE